MTENNKSSDITVRLRRVVVDILTLFSPKERKDLYDEASIADKINPPHQINEIITAVGPVVNPKRMNQKEFIAAYKDIAKSRCPNLKNSEREEKLKEAYKMYKENPEVDVLSFFKPADSQSLEIVVAAPQPLALMPVAVQPKGPGRPAKYRFTAKEKINIWNHWIGEAREHKCLSCYGANPTGKLINRDAFECGHIKAETFGGTHGVTNVIPICTTCNRSMGSKHMIEYVTKNFAANLINRLRGIHPDWNPEQ